ncbi:MAG: hypothetical protein Q9170_008366, partial [Blastenia crenularia]
TEIATLAEIEREIYLGMEALEDAFEALHGKAETVRIALRQRGAGLAMANQMRRGNVGGGNNLDARLGTPAGVGWESETDDGLGDEGSELAPDDSASNVSRSRRRRPGRRHERRTPAMVEEEDEEGNCLVLWQLMATPQDLRILCFGASITAGFYSFGLKHHPHAKRLKERLRVSLPSANISIDIEALSGDRVIGGNYLPRLRPHFNSDPPKKYDWVIFQGGGNDLGWGKEPTAIFDALQECWRICLDADTQVMALTVTETSGQSKRTRERYEKLNALIKGHREDGYFVADVCAKVPYSAMSEEMRKKIYDDGLHFKPAGYDMIGDAIADRMLEVLGKNYPQERL